MGLLDNMRQAGAERQAAKERQAQAAALAAWQERDQQLAQALDLAQAGGISDQSEIPLQLKKGEQAFVAIRGVALVEPRRLPGQWVGRSQGVSFRIAKGVSYRVGASRGTYQQGAEVPTPIDNGTATITNRRVVFQGMKQSREWQFSKLLGFQHDEALPMTAIQVSNRQKVSGVLYDWQTAEAFRLRLAVGLAWADGDAGEVIPQLKQLITEHRAQRPRQLGPQVAVPAAAQPAPSLAPARSSTPAGWHPDPSGRHQSRYWSGTKWTQHVADNGVSSTDPV